MQKECFQDAIYAAAINGKCDELRSLLNENQEIDVAVCEMALKSAAYYGQTKAVQLLLRVNGINVNSADHDKRPDCALRNAVYAGHDETVRVLLEHKANVHALSASLYPDSVLRQAAWKGHTNTVRVLLQYKANVDDFPEHWHRDYTPTYTPLGGAVIQNHFESVLTLIVDGGSNICLLPPNFVRRHLTAGVDPMQPDVWTLVSRWLRLGPSNLRALASSLQKKHDGLGNCLLSDVAHTTQHCITLLSQATTCCQDICTLAISYV